MEYNFANDLNVKINGKHNAILLDNHGDLLINGVHNDLIADNSDQYQIVVINGDNNAICFNQKCDKKKQMHLNKLVSEQN